MRFREHRGGLAESLETQVDLRDREELFEYCRELLKIWSFSFNRDQFHVKQYGTEPDYRVEPPWNTHIVSVDGYGVVGFTDGPC